MYLKYFKIFGVDKFVMRLSLHNPEKLGQKYVNEPELWKETEDLVRKVLIETGTPFIEVQDEAAFYGPKIDVQIWSVIGREFTLATNQVDFAQSRSFKLSFTNQNNEPEIPLIIHRAPLGTHERFIGFLLEHYAGKFPVINGQYWCELHSAGMEYYFASWYFVLYLRYLVLYPRYLPEARATGQGNAD